jgi:hypothetical protein
MRSLIEALTEDEETFTPPRAVQAAAKKALEVRAAKPESEKGMTSVGMATARLLASGKPVSLTKVRHIARYFPRHEVDKRGSTWDEQGKGWQAWMGWGGDAAWSWADGIVKKHGSD